MNLFIRLKYFLKRLTGHDKNKDINIFNSVKPGDSVFCLMPLGDHILKKIDKDHRIRPYVIIGKREDKLIAFSCSTSFIPKGPKYSYHTLDGKTYGEDRDSYVDLTKTYVIPISNIRSFFHSLKIEDQMIINKKLDMLKNKRSATDMRLSVRVHPSIGDIIAYDDGSYYIFEINRENLKAIKTVNQLPSHYVDLHNNFFLDLDKIITIDKDQDFKYIGMSGNTYQELLKKRLRQNSREVVHLFKEGTIMADKDGIDILVYLYTIDKRHYVIDLTAYFTGKIERDLTYIQSCDSLKGLHDSGIIDQGQLTTIKTYLKENGTL